MKFAEANAVQFIFLLAILLFAGVASASPSLQNTRVILSRGLVSYPSQGSGSYPPQVNVTVNPSRILTVNNLILGFQLDGNDISPWRTSSALREKAQDANFRLVRFFEHRLGKPCTYWDASTKTGKWDWSRIDDLVGKVFATGGEPLIVLGFYSWTYNSLTSAPTGMPSDPKTGLPYPDQWAAYCAEWVKHFKTVGLPVRYYEIINEPHHYFGWGGSNTTRLGYFKDIFNAAAVAMRNANPNIKLGNDNSMVRSNNLNKWMASNLEPLDFLSWHRYISGDKSESDASLISKAESNEGCTYGPSSFIDPARQDYFNIRGKWLPVIQSEGNLCYVYSGGTDQRTQTMLGAVTTALSLKLLILKNVSYNIYFTFGGEPNWEWGNFGMVNLDTNEPWYPYCVQYIIGNNIAVGDSIVYSESSSSDVSSLAWIHKGKLNVLLVNKVDEKRTVGLENVGSNMIYFKLENTSPSIQSGNLKLGENLTMNGYSVVLIQNEG